MTHEGLTMPAILRGITFFEIKTHDNTRLQAAARKGYSLGKH
jgi:hypothetical protein